MQEEAFNQGIMRLQSAFGKNYEPEMLRVMWDKVQTWNDDSWKSIVEHLIETKDRLPHINSFFGGRTAMRESRAFGFDSNVAMESCGGCRDGIRYVEQMLKDDTVEYAVMRCGCPVGEKYRGLPDMASVKKSWHFRRIMGQEETPAFNANKKRKIPLMGEPAERFGRIVNRINSGGVNAGLQAYLMQDMGEGNPVGTEVIKEEDIPF